MGLFLLKLLKVCHENINKCGYVRYHFNVHILLFFLLMTLVAVYFIFIFD